MRGDIALNGILPIQVGQDGIERCICERLAAGFNCFLQFFQQDLAHLAGQELLEFVQITDSVCENFSTLGDNLVQGIIQQFLYRVSGVFLRQLQTAGIRGLFHEVVDSVLKLILDIAEPSVTAVKGLSDFVDQFLNRLTDLRGIGQKGHEVRHGLTEHIVQQAFLDPVPAVCLQIIAYTVLQNIAEIIILVPTKFFFQLVGNVKEKCFKC